MKKLLIGINSQFVHMNLAIRSLRASCDFNIDFLEFNINTDKVSVFSQILEQNADILMFSTYIWNIDYVLDIACDLKMANHNIKIVLGGPEVSFTAKEIIEKYDFIDYILCGECETILPEFIKRLENNKKLDGLTGVVCKEYCNDTYNIVENINILKKASEIYDNLEENRIYYYETTRGCPFSCSYCLSGSIKDTTRYLDLDRVFEDLTYFSQNNIPLVKFVDRTFNANKKRAKQIIEFACKNTKDTCFHFEVGADILDDEIIKMLNSAPKGKVQLEAGVQSCNEKTLSSVVRVTNIEKLSQNVKKIVSANNVHIHLDLIAGLPFEDYNSFGNSVNKIFDMRPHHIQLGFLKMLKGSVILQDAKKYDIKYRQYAPYEVISTKFLTAVEICKLKDIEEVIERYYNADVGKNSLEILLFKFKDAFSMFEALAIDFREKGYLSRPLSLSNRLDVLCDFASKYLKNDDWQNFLLCVLQDYLKNGGKGKMTSHLDSILLKVDNKKYKNYLFEQKKINGEQFKKGKFVLIKIDEKTQILMTYNNEISVWEDLC